MTDPPIRGELLIWAVHQAIIDEYYAKRITKIKEMNRKFSVIMKRSAPKRKQRLIVLDKIYKRLIRLWSKHR